MNTRSLSGAAPRGLAVLASGSGVAADSGLEPAESAKQVNSDHDSEPQG